MRCAFRLSALALALALGTPAAAAVPTTAKTWPQYLAVKTAMQPFGRDRAARIPGGSFDLEMCVAGSGYLGKMPARDVMPAFADIAFDVVAWKAVLQRSGYPPALWQTALAAYEQRAVGAVIATAPGSNPRDALDRVPEFAGPLVRVLAAYRRSHPRLPEVVSIGGCGATDLTVSIATEPKGGQVLFIPTFFYDLCRVQKQNPDDPQQCPRWREALEGRLTEVMGNYVYRARWHDGAVRRGTLNFAQLDDGATILLRKP